MRRKATTGPVRVAGILLAIVALAALSATAAFGQDYPRKPVTAIVAFNPGGGTDIAARVILKAAEKYFGGTFVVDNRPGAGGAIGFTAIATAPKDGYTIGMINPPTVLLNPIQLGDKVKYKLEDFYPIANFVSDPGACAVPNGSPFKTLQDAIDAARKSPDTMRFGYGGPGTSEALTLRKLEQVKGIKVRKVPFSGTGPQLTALLGNQIDIMFTNASEIVSQYASKSLRVLAVGSEKRIDMMPDVPTYRESGFDAVQVAMRGLAAPRGVDPRYLKILSDAMKKTFDDPEFKQKARELNLPLDYLGPEDYMKTLQSLDAFYRAEFAKDPW